MARRSLPGPYSALYFSLQYGQHPPQDAQFPVHPPFARFFPLTREKTASETITATAATVAIVTALSAIHANIKPRSFHCFCFQILTSLVSLVASLYFLMNSM